MGIHPPTNLVERTDDQIVFVLVHDVVVEHFRLSRRNVSGRIVGRAAGARCPVETAVERRRLRAIYPQAPVIVVQKSGPILRRPPTMPRRACFVRQLRYVLFGKRLRSAVGEQPMQRPNRIHRRKFLAPRRELLGGIRPHIHQPAANVRHRTLQRNPRLERGLAGDIIEGPLQGTRLHVDFVLAQPTLHDGRPVSVDISRLNRVPGPRLQNGAWLPYGS